MKRRFYDASTRGMTRAEREMGNTSEDREVIANAAVIPRGRHYQRAMDDIDAGAKPKTTGTDADTDKTK